MKVCEKHGDAYMRYYRRPDASSLKPVCLKCDRERRAARAPPATRRYSREPEGIPGLNAMLRAWR